ncbi:hypothetical protein [Flavobacterium gyeonganense]|uniref:Acyltransferase n=1 Tax=Flavobacterium gyeonganense TaxID=1310418 RepID=A0ABV5HGA8_9FLAO|nr:hypothetical protein [Flavobacterium gyeonganense]
MNKILKFFEIKFRFLFTKSIVRGHKKSKIYIGKNVTIENSKIVIFENSTLHIDDNTVIKNVNMKIKGKVDIGKYNIIDNGYLSSKIFITINGSFSMGDFNRIRCAIWSRFDSILSIGCHNNINEETEIRADERVVIGDYNQISYKCLIWDTNTHNIYPDSKRRDLTNNFYPIFGYEFEKPSTKPVSIANDCWIGREVAILKGVEIKNSCVIGYRTTLSNCIIDKNKVVVSKSNNVIHDRTNND